MNALKTISLRIRGATAELEEAGLETDNMAESTAKLREDILALSGVDIMLDSSTFKSTYDILDELSDKWQDLTDIQQAAITELMAGKHQANIFSSLVENFDTAREVMEISANSAGSAMKEHEKWSQSLEARLTKLKSTWQSFSQSFLDSEFLKSAVSFLTTILDLLDKLVNTFGTLGTISLFTSGGGLIKYFKNLKSLKSASEIADVADAVSDVTSSMTNGIEAGVKYTYAIDDVVDATTDMVSGGSKVVDAMGNVVKSTSKATTGFKAFFGTLAGKLTIFGAIAAGLLLVYNAIKKAKEEAAEARRETIETSDAFLESATSFEQAYIKYSGRTNLTAAEESELESAINGTVDALGDKSSALQDVVNGSNDYVASLEAIKNAELDAAVAAATKKRDNAELDLEEAAYGWYRWNGSSVNITGIDADSKEYEAANNLDSKYFYSKKQRVNDLGGTATVAGFELPKDANTKEIIDYYNSLVAYQQKLKETLSDDELANSSVYKEVSAAIESMSDAIDTYIEGVYEAAKAQYQLDNGIPKTIEDYIKMREAILSNEDLNGLPIDTLKSIANSLDSDYSQVFDLSSVQFQARKLVGILDEYGDNEVSQMETFLNMRTAVNNNECTVGEYMSQFDKIDDMMEGWSDEAKEELKLSFGLDTDSVKQQYEELEKYLLRNVKTTGRLTPRQQETYDAAKKDIQEFLDSLTASELSAFVSIKTEIDWENTSKKEILAQIQKEAEFQEAMNYTIAIDVETESLDALNSALSESVSATGLSSESIAALKSRYAELASQGYDLSAMFEETSNGIHLNKAAVSELEQALASQKLAETDEQLDVLKDRYDELTDKIKNCTDAEERAALYTEQQTIVAKINDLATLAAQYEGLASSYNAWQNAESAGNERDYLI